MGDESYAAFRTDRRAHLGLDSRASALQRSVRFDGATFDPALDKVRLTGQLERVQRLMADGQWRTLKEIQAVVGGSEAGLSARLRDIRKPRFGGRNVERRRRSVSLWEYRVLP